MRRFVASLARNCALRYRASVAHGCIKYARPDRAAYQRAHRGADDYVELLNRVDVIPPSLALAQAASESGWGTSRFAREGNALFGQWTWGGKGMTPAEQRTDTHGDYRVAAFESTALSAYSYALNLNTGNAYRDLRLRRAELRRQNLRVSGNSLAETL